MKKTLLILTLLAIYCSSAWANGVFSLRGATLGMNRQTVAKIESGALVDTGEDSDAIMLYELQEPVLGLEQARIMYYFTNPAFADAMNVEEDRLFAIGLMSRYYAAGDVSMTPDFKRFIAELEKIYGAPNFYGLMENGELDWFCNEGYASMAQSFKNGLTGWVFWQASDFYINVNMINNDGPNGRFICLTGVLDPGGPLGRRFVLKE